MNTKIYIFEKTPRPPFASKLFFVSITLSVIMMYSIFIIAAVLCFSESAVVAGTLLLILPVIAVGFLIRFTIDLRNEYVHFKESNIELHTFILGHQKIHVFSYEEMTEILKIPGFPYSSHLKGIRLWYQTYFVMCNHKNKCMLKILVTPYSEEIVKSLINKYQISYTEKDG